MGEIVRGGAERRPGRGRGRGRGRGCTWNPSHSVEVGEEILTDDEEISEGSEEEDKEEQGSRRRAVMAV